MAAVRISGEGGDLVTGGRRVAGMGGRQGEADQDERKGAHGRERGGLFS